MKKLLCVLMPVLIVLSLAACGADEGDKDVTIVEEKVFEFDEENQCTVSVLENKTLMVKFKFDGEDLERDKFAFRCIYATMASEKIDGHISLLSGDIRVKMQVLDGDREIILGELGEMDWPDTAEIDDLSEAEEKYGDVIWNIEKFICRCADRPNTQE